MRTTTSPELTVLAASTRQVTLRIKVENGSGTMIDLSTWVERVMWDMDIDQPVSGATIFFSRASGATQSLSPLRTDSTLNLKDDLVTVSPQLDVGRAVTIEIATTAIGAAVVGGDYKLMFSGTIDIVNFEDTPVNVICRDAGGLLVDRWVGPGFTTTAGVGTVTALLGAATFSTSQAGVLANGYTITVPYALPGVATPVSFLVSGFSGTTSATLAVTSTPGNDTFPALGFTISPNQTYIIYGQTPGTGTVRCALGTAQFSVSQAGVLANGDQITVNNYIYSVSAFSGTTSCILTPTQGGPNIFPAKSFIRNARPLETVMQDILDRWVGSGSLFPITVPLNTPVSPSFLVTAYKQAFQSVMEALQAIASMIGWDIRYKYDNASGTFKLTLSLPDRAKTVPDYTFGPSAYFKVNRLNIDRTNIRNYIEVSYFTPNANRISFAVGDATSQTRYGFRYMKIDLPDDSPINSPAEASAMANAVLSDLKDPKAEQEIELPFFWPVELGDLLRHSTNAVHYNANQDYAVVRIEHDISAGSHRTTLKTRGTPAGMHTNWFPPPRVFPSPYTPRLTSPTGAVFLDAEDGTVKAALSIPQSTSLAMQGSLLPTPTDSVLFAFNAGGPATNKMWSAFTWAAFSIGKPDGNSISIPASSALPAPPTPTVSQVVAGALGARTLFVRIGYVKNNMIYRVGAETSIAVGANNVLKVTSPAPVLGYDGWIPLVGTTSNGEFIQTSSPFDTDYTEAVGGFNSTTTTPYDNTWMPTGVTAQALPATTAIYWYAYLDIGSGLVTFADRGNTTKTATSAQSQNADGHVGLTPGAMTFITPAGGGTLSGAPTNPGGRYL